MILAKKLMAAGIPPSGVSPFTYVGCNKKSSGPTINIPSGAQAGDVGVHFDIAGKLLGSPTTVLPSGWTQLHSLSVYSGHVKYVSSWKVLTSGDISAGSVSGMNDSWMSKFLLVMRPPSGTPVVLTNPYVSSSGNPDDVVVDAQTNPYFIAASNADDGNVSWTYTSGATEFTKESFMDLAVWIDPNETITLAKGDNGNYNIMEAVVIGIS